MTYQDAIRKINKLLGLNKFSSYKLKDSTSELILEGDLAVDEPVYVLTNNGQLPAQDGEYELDDTTKIKIEDGKVQEIKYDMETKTENFVEAMLKDGTVVKSPTFDVGEDVKVVTADGKETPAPDGEHELTLKDSEGKEVLFKIITKDGKIVERENVELAKEGKKDVEEEMGMVPDLSEGNDIIDADFKKTIMGMLEEIKDAVKGVVKDQEEMKAKVAKFSKEPAGEPVKQPKNVTEQFNANKSDAFSKLLKIRHNI
jgi:ribosomal protein L30/L7E